MISLKVSETLRDLQGNVTERNTTNYAPMLTELTTTTQRLDAAGKMVFSLVEDTGIAIREGAKVTCRVDDEPLFAGYVFKAERNQKHRVQYTCYDQLRYLKAKASYAFKAISVEDIIRQIAKDFQLKVGELANTGYKIPSLIKDNTACLDIIFAALMETTIQTGKVFIFYDDFGELTLVESKKLKWNKLIGDASLLSEYSYSRSIDSNTYNRIKLARPNSNTGRADTYVSENSETQKQWGVLQLYKVVDENMNAAQIDQLCQTYLKYYDKVWQTLKLSKIIGETKIRAGWFVPVMLSDIENTSKVRYFLAEKVTHKFKGDLHTMDIEVKNIDEV